MEKCCIFAAAKLMVDVAQLVRVPDCGSVGRGFESHLPPKAKETPIGVSFLLEWIMFQKKVRFLSRHIFKPQKNICVFPESIIFVASKTNIGALALDIFRSIRA